MTHVRQTPGHLIMQGRRIVSSLPVGTHKKVLRRAVSGIFRQKVASSYSPYAVGSLTARRWPLCVSCHRGSSVRVARTGPCRLSQSPGP
jgi:hypothetical protein